MSQELGSAMLNSTWFVDRVLAAGCHSYWIVGTDALGTRFTAPTTGALTVSVGGAPCPAS
jgi:hypothetical protein